MEAKKYTHADLEKQRLLFLQIGLALSLALVLLMFRWNISLEGDTDYRSLQRELSQDEVIPVQIQLPQTVIHHPVAPSRVIRVVRDKKKVEEKKMVESEPVVQEEVLPESEAEVTEETGTAGQVYLTVEEMPEFPGGLPALELFLKQNIRYPEAEKRNGIQGTVFISFIIDASGAVTQARIERGMSKGLDAEALRVVQMMPLWKPGRMKGRNVKVWHQLPVTFRLM